jgi:hypothetical protein
MQARRIMLGLYLDQEIIDTISEQLGVEPVRDDEDVVEEDIVNQ